MANSIKNDIVLAGKIAAFSTLIAGLTGEAPAVEYTDEYAQINFSDNQKQILQQYIEKNLRAKPGAVRIDYNSIFTPPLFRVYGKYAIMALVAAYLMGRLTAK